MRKRNWYTYAKSHNLVNRIYDMLDYFKIVKNKDKNVVKDQIFNKLKSIYYIENLAKYFDEQLKKNWKNIELRCNLVDLIYDLDGLKQYLEKRY